MKKLWLLLGVVHTGVAMDAVNDDAVGVGVAGDHSQHTWADLASRRTSYYSTHAPCASHALAHNENAVLAELMMTVDDAPISEEGNPNQQADLKKATKNIWYKLHPQDSSYPKCTVVENAISPYENVYSSMNNRLDYFFGPDRAVNDSDQYLSCVHHKSLNQRAKVQNNFVEVLDEILDVGSRVALYGKDHPVVTASLRRINQTKLLAKQIEYYHRFPGFPLLRHQTRKCWFYFHNRVLSELACTATEKVLPFDNELTNITNLTRKHNWSYFHDRVLVQLVRQHCLKVIGEIEAEEAYHDDGIKTVWELKMPSHSPRFADYYARQTYWPYFRDRVLPELMVKHDSIFKEVLARRALKMIAQYKQQRTQEASNGVGTSSAALLDAESAIHSCTQA
ncbi:hypothetical protein Noda2021_05470 [Candidatus Dependentiae bacterium Noda2021]|nr:hypothetical protein Noda2021_05470 [Candidatus Dependentiae bacterium Noda2021]